jgi:hypothetical protein
MPNSRKRALNVNQIAFFEKNANAQGTTIYLNFSDSNGIFQFPVSETVEEMLELVAK